MKRNKFLKTITPFAFRVAIVVFFITTILSGCVSEKISMIKDTYQDVVQKNSKRSIKTENQEIGCKAKNKDISGKYSAECQNGLAHRQEISRDKDEEKENINSNDISSSLFGMKIGTPRKIFEKTYALVYNSKKRGFELSRASVKKLNRKFNFPTSSEIQSVYLHFSGKYKKTRGGGVYQNYTFDENRLWSILVILPKDSHGSVKDLFTKQMKRGPNVVEALTNYWDVSTKIGKAVYKGRLGIGHIPFGSNKAGSIAKLIYRSYPDDLVSKLNTRVWEQKKAQEERKKQESRKKYENIKLN